VRDRSFRYLTVSVLCLALLAIVMFIIWIVNRQVEVMHKKEVLAISEQLHNDMVHFARDNDGHLPESLQAMIDSGYIESIPVNPFTDTPFELFEGSARTGSGMLEFIVINRDDEGEPIECEIRLYPKEIDGMVITTCIRK